MFLESDLYNLSCIVSTIDGNKYCVRVRDDLKQQDVVDLLAKVTVKCKKVVKYMNEKYGEKENVKRLYKNFNPKKNSRNFCENFRILGILQEFLNSLRFLAYLGFGGFLRFF